VIVKVLSSLRIRGIAYLTTTLSLPNRRRIRDTAVHDATTPKFLNLLDRLVRDVHQPDTSHTATTNHLVVLLTNTDQLDTILSKLTVPGTVESTASPANTANVARQDSRLTARRTTQ
jgi:hypothetical protein